MLELNKTVQCPVSFCRCGWTSFEPKFDLKYHAEKHNCKLAKKDLKKCEA